MAARRANMAKRNIEYFLNIEYSFIDAITIQQTLVAALSYEVRQRYADAAVPAVFSDHWHSG